ncbi:peptidase dimerization domain-containing protein [uncultured Sutterella sp.]|uniref:peptidase dimerization domain-containing protein n=1 Tax=uncultured Sutterella sp. TaxID=286133 RepID=UPI0026241F84|nr:peptidase dimerization domain-containing protein [uncultured Sutterella sp.]
MLKIRTQGTTLLIMLLLSGSALAATQTLEVSLRGPGGHSNGNYGNTNAVHAAARSVMEIEKAVPDAVIANLNGGSTVNAIAASASFEVTLTAKDEKTLEAMKDKVVEAVKKGTDAENAFRGVKPGDKTSIGAPAAVRYEIR